MQEAWVAQGQVRAPHQSPGRQFQTEHSCVWQTCSVPPKARPGTETSQVCYIIFQRRENYATWSPYTDAAPEQQGQPEEYEARRRGSQRTLEGNQLAHSAVPGGWRHWQPASWASGAPETIWPCGWPLPRLLRQALDQCLRIQTSRPLASLQRKSWLHTGPAQRADRERPLSERFDPWACARLRREHWVPKRVQCPVHRVSATSRSQVHHIGLQRRVTLPLNGVIGVSGRRRLEPCRRGGARNVNGMNWYTHHELDCVRGLA